MTDTSTAPPRRSTLMLAVAGLALGVALGVAVDVVWPNTVYGFQIYAAAIALAVLVVAAVVRPWVPSGLPFAVGAMVGIVAGMMLGLAVLTEPSATAVADVELELETPVQERVSGQALCLTERNATVPFLFTADDGSDLTLESGVGLVIGISLGEGAAVGSTTRQDGLGIEVRIVTSLPDGSPTMTWMGSDEESTLEINGDAAAGSMAFSGLSLHPDSEQQEPIDVSGSVRWTCPAG